MIGLRLAIVLLFTILMIKFRSFREPIAVMFGAVLAMFDAVAAL